MSETWPTNAALHREHLQLLADHRETMVRLRDLRDEFRDYRRHVGANLASLNELAAELTAQVTVLSVEDDDNSFVAMTVGVLRALTFNLGYQFRGETRPGDWDPDVDWRRLTEASAPAAVTVTRPDEPKRPSRAWHADWAEAGRDGDGNAILKHKSTGGRYKILPVEEC